MERSLRWRGRHGSALLMFLVFAGAVLQACAPPPRLESPPKETALQAVPLDLPRARIWAALEPSKFVELASRSGSREMTYLNLSNFGDLPPSNLLAISGGGGNGAFGAGLLVGWTESGTRPEFKVVTGVSTGAFIAPYAFLGSDYDELLGEMYKTVSVEDIYEERGFLAALLADALTDTKPLQKLIADRINDEIIAAIAREHARGRVLLIATTNLDAQQPIIWNIGAIAASGDPGAPALIHKVLLASAAIPGVFPPVMIDVQVDGEPYQEMHVDGGTMAQLFLYPAPAGELGIAAGLVRERRAFIIRNGFIGRDWTPVQRQTIDIAGRAIQTLVFSSSVNDIVRTYFIAQRDGIEFNYAFIGDDFETPKSRDEFDPAYLRALYEYGYEKGRKGFEWHKVPPFWTRPSAQ